jgi:hypothetical protein
LPVNPALSTLKRSVVQNDFQFSDPGAVRLLALLLADLAGGQFPSWALGAIAGRLPVVALDVDASGAASVCPGGGGCGCGL